MSVLHGSHICCNFADENQVKAGQLGVMEALLEALSVHTRTSEVSHWIAGALGNICENGIDQRY